jgi:hypothetical protein
MRSRAVSLTCIAMVLALSAGASSANAAGSMTFSRFTLAGIPLAPAGVSCPGQANCYNQAAEPAIRANPAGEFFASSENGLGNGTDAWQSADGGRH